MEIDHHSDEYDNAPMPYSIFFTQTGVAMHGTYEQRSLGHAVSHGCVRLSVKNAATLWKLVKSEKMANTTVVLDDKTSNPKQPTLAVSQPMLLTPDEPAEHTSPPLQYRRVYDDRLPMLSPYFR
jgi:hypothetical protein